LEVTQLQTLDPDQIRLGIALHCPSVVVVINADVCSALETGLGTLLTSVEKTVESAVNAHRAAAKAVSAHTDLLKKAMDVSSASHSVHLLNSSSITSQQQRLLATGTLKMSFRATFNLQSTDVFQFVKKTVTYYACDIVYWPQLYSFWSNST